MNRYKVTRLMPSGVEVLAESEADAQERYESEISEVEEHVGPIYNVELIEENVDPDED